MRKFFVLLIMLLLLPAAALHAQESETAQVRVANFSEAEIALDINNGEHEFTLAPGEVSDFIEVAQLQLSVTYHYNMSAGFNGMTLTAGDRVALLFYPGYSDDDPEIMNTYIREDAPTFASDLIAVTFIDARDVAFEGGLPNFAFLSLVSGDQQIALPAQSTEAFGAPSMIFVQPGEYTAEIYEGAAESPIGDSLSFEAGAENVVVIVTGSEGILATAAIYTLPR